MKKIYTILLIFCLLPISIFAQVPGWQKLYGGANPDVAKHIQFDPMGGDGVILGTTQSFGNGGSDFYAIIVDDFGNPITTTTFGTTANEVLNSAYVEFALAKYTNSFLGAGFTDASGDKDILIIKFDGTGNVTDTISYHTPNDDEIIGIFDLDEYSFYNNALAIGYKTNDVTLDKDVLLIGVDNESLFDTTISQSFGNPNADEVAVSFCADNGVKNTGIGAVAGYQIDPAFNKNIMLFGIDYSVMVGNSYFTVTWQDTIDLPNGDEAANVIIFDQWTYSGFIVGGYNTTVGGDKNAYICKFDQSMGVVVWETSFGDALDDEVLDIKMVDSMIYVTGYTTNPINGDKDMFLTIISCYSGNIISEKIIGESNIDEIGYSIAINNNMCLPVIAGEKDNNMIAIKTNYIGNNFNNFNVSCNGANDGQAIANYPPNTVYETIWYNALMSQFNSYVDTVSNLVPGNYFLVTMDYSCSLIDSFTITEPLVLVLDSSVIPASCGGLCDGEGTLIVTGGTQPYVYLWENASNVPTETGLCAGNYLATVTDFNGCQEFIEVHIPELLSATIIGDVNATSYGPIPDFSAIAYLLKFENSFEIDTLDAALLSSGHYEFYDIYPGDYLIQISLINGTSMPNVLDTYHDSAYSWADGQVLSINCEDIINLTSSMYEMIPVATGNGSIFGNIVYGSGTKGMGEPVPGAEVYIEQEPNDEPVANSETDINGDYHFGDIGFGNGYNLTVDIPGFPLIETYTDINITSIDTVFGDLNFYVDTSSGSEGIYVDEVSSIDNNDKIQVSYQIYPNPFEKEFSILYSLTGLANVNITIFDLSGRKIETIINDKQDTGEYFYKFNSEKYNISNGTLIVKITINNTTYIKKVVGMK